MPAAAPRSPRRVELAPFGRRVAASARAHDRPRERLRHLGSEALTPAELLANVIACGTCGRSALMLAADLLNRFGSLRALAASPLIALASQQGFGCARAARVIAALELGRRRSAEEQGARPPMYTAAQVHATFAPRLANLPVEEFHVAMLDAQHRLERDVTVTRGILNALPVNPRDVFREAIAERAAAIILVHNHPSGDPTPSADDRLISEQLVAAGQLLDIPVHDHLIISRGSYVSFADIGALRRNRT